MAPIHPSVSVFFLFSIDSFNCQPMHSMCHKAIGIGDAIFYPSANESEASVERVSLEDMGECIFYFMILLIKSN